MRSRTEKIMNQNNEMSIEETIERAAMHGEKIPPDLTPPQVMLYHTLAALYARYRTKTISKEEAKDLKRQILNIYRKMDDEYNQFISICKEYQKQIVNNYQKTIDKSENV